MSCRIHLTNTLVLITLVSGGNVMGKAGDQSWSQQSTYVSNSQVTSKFMAKDFVPDGNLRKPVWGGAAWVKVDHDAFSPAIFPQSAMEIASLWTAEFVYFAFRCKYTTLNLYEGGDTSKDFFKLWERDVVEVFLNPQPEHMGHYYEFEVAPNNLWIDLEIDLDKKPFGNAQWDSGFEHATHIDVKNHVWACEMRIPLASMKVTHPLEAGTEWRLNFFRADGPGADAQRCLLAWSPVHSGTHSFHSPWSFGVIRFVE